MTKQDKLIEIYEDMIGDDADTEIEVLCHLLKRVAQIDWDLTDRELLAKLYVRSLPTAELDMLCRIHLGDENNEF